MKLTSLTSVTLAAWGASLRSRRRAAVRPPKPPPRIRTSWAIGRGYALASSSAVHSPPWRAPASRRPWRAKAAATSPASPRMRPEAISRSGERALRLQLEQQLQRQPRRHVRAGAERLAGIDHDVEAVAERLLPRRPHAQ